MKQIVIGFGLLILSLLVLFRLADYGMIRLHYRIQVWIAAFSVIFFILGIFLSCKLFRKEIIKEKEVIIEVVAGSEIAQ